MDGRLSDQFEIEKQIIRFFVALDNREFEAMTAVLTEDGVWRRGGVDIPGRKGLLEVMADRPTDRISRHMINNVLVSFSSDDVATVMFYSTAWVHLGPTENAFAPMDLPSSMSVYNAKFAKVDGTWHMQHLSSKPTFKRAAAGKA